MTNTVEDRLASVMRAVAPDLRPDPGLAGLAVEQSRRTRRWRWIVVPIATAIATAAAFLLVVVLLHGNADLPGLDVDPATGNLRAAPDWAGCRLSSFDQNPTPLPADPVAIAVCGPVDPLVAQTVWVAGASEARAIAERLAGSEEGTWIDTCAYEQCVETRFALLGSDGTFVELWLSQAGAAGGVAGSSKYSWILDEQLVSDILGIRHTGARYVYPRPTAVSPGPPMR